MSLEQSLLTMKEMLQKAEVPHSEDMYVYATGEHEKAYFLQLGVPEEKIKVLPRLAT